MKYTTKFLLFLFFSTYMMFSQDSSTVQVLEDVKKGIELFQAGKYHAAKKILEPKYAKGDRSKPVLFCVYKIYYVGEEWNKAMEIIKDNEKTMLREDNVVNDLVHIYFELEELEKGKTVLDTSKKNQRYYHQMARWLLLSKKYNELHDFITEFKNKMSTSQYERYFYRVLDQFNARINVLRSEKKNEDAIRIARVILSMEYNKQVQFLLASLLYTQGRLNESEKEVEKIKLEKADGKDLFFNRTKLLGMIYAKTSRLDEALNFLKQAEQIKAIDFDLNYYLTLCYYKQGVMKRAIEYCEKSLKIKETPEILKLASFIYARESDYKSSVKYSIKYMKLRPKDNQMKLNLNKMKSYIFFDSANEAFDSKDYTRAEKYYAQAIKSFPPPTKPVFIIMQANAMIQNALTRKPPNTNKILKAEKMILKYISDKEVMLDVTDLLNQIYTETGQLQKANEILEKQEKMLQIADHTLFYKFAYNYELQNNFEKALVYYKKAFKEVRSEIKYQRKVLLCLGNLSQLAMNDEKYDLADQHIKEGLKINKDDEDLLLLTKKLLGLKNKDLLIKTLKEAETYFYKGDFKGALEKYLIANDLSVDFKGLTGSIASCYRKIGDYKNAAIYYQKLNDEKNSKTAKLGHLYSLQSMGRYQDIVEASDLYLRGGIDKNLRASIVNLQVGAYNKLGQIKKADALIVKELKANSENLNMLIVRGNMLYSAGKLPQAEYYYKKVLSKKNNLIANINMALVSLKKEKFKSSLAFLKAAIKMFNPKKDLKMAERYYFNMARTHYFLKLPVEASKEIQKAMDLFNATQDQEEVKKLNYYFWYCKIKARQKTKSIPPELKKTLMAYLDFCINNKSDKNMSFNASALKVYLFSELKITLDIKISDQDTSDATFSGEYFIYQNREKAIIAIHEKTGAKVWSKKESAALSSPIYIGTYITYATENEFIKGLNPHTGEEVFKIKDYAKLLYSKGKQVIYVNDKLNRGGANGKIFATKLTVKNPLQLFHFKKTGVLLGKDNVQLFNENNGATKNTLKITGNFKTGIKSSYIYMLNNNKSSKSASSKVDTKAGYLHLYSIPDNKFTSTLRLKESFKTEHNIEISDKYLLHYSLNAVYCYDLTKRKNIWNYKSKIPIMDVKIDGKSVYLTTTDDKLSMLTLATGKTGWSTTVVMNEGFATILSRK